MECINFIHYFILVRTIPDTYYIYNIINNSFQYVPLTSPTSSGTTVARFGHFGKSIEYIHFDYFI